MTTRSDNGEQGRQAQRKAAMAVLAHVSTTEIAGQLELMALPPHENLREAENGLVMVRGRIGGDGAPFNLGEATVARAAVRLATGEVGFGYALGPPRRQGAADRAVRCAGAVKCVCGRRRKESDRAAARDGRGPARPHGRGDCGDA